MSIQPITIIISITQIVLVSGTKNKLIDSLFLEEDNKKTIGS